jgi:hypothetical protein
MWKFVKSAWPFWRYVERATQSTQVSEVTTESTIARAVDRTMDSIYDHVARGQRSTLLALHRSPV